MSEPVALPGMDPIDRLAVLEAGLPGAVVGRRRVGRRYAAQGRGGGTVRRSVGFFCRG